MERPVFDPKERSRYHRHFILPGIGETGQEKIKQSRVLLIGLGGLGSAAALYLAAAGVGRLGLLDSDIVEETNLQRQVLYHTGQIGRHKVDSAADRIAAINPWVNITPHRIRLDETNASELIEGYDVIVDATDNFRSRYCINHACVDGHKPMVYGAVYQFEGQVSVFAPHLGSPCYQCVFKEISTEPTEPVGIFGAVPGVIGSLQALEVLKLITGMGLPLLGKLLLMDILENRFQSIQLSPNTTCPICGNQGETQ